MPEPITDVYLDAVRDVLTRLQAALTPPRRMLDAALIKDEIDPWDALEAMQDENNQQRQHIAVLEAAARAALAYDAEIQRVAALGKSWVTSGRLDELYADWLAKTRAALGVADTD